ncbi:deazaflavin-dependent oxidoreductase (nitroreductase family) [Herbihabitans rhizosphaerae]|uniref:Deazaflavin-dependent oxidoreductase (Nitroreductase family) n=2 Tax=Herbihabitans rhizosphaerae TaxID=1872711 RepID=A0A4Q7KLV3_9PSEU|nr:deazaflavin-dependent oxidoreductase (nitroreductase family) [Herbihabitans rhizosphaerae]
MHTVGAKTGRARTNGLVYGRDGERYLVVPSNGGAARAPGWYHNVRARPECEIQIGTDRRDAIASMVTREDPDFERLWKIVNSVNHNRYDAYQKATERPIPIVVLTPTA